MTERESGGKGKRGGSGNVYDYVGNEKGDGAVDDVCEDNGDDGDEDVGAGDGKDG